MGLVRVVRRHLLPETVIRGGRSLSGGFGDLLLKHTTRLRSLVLRDQCKRPAQFRKELSALYRGDRFRPGREQTYREHLVPSGLRGGEGKMQRIQARDSHRQACPFCFLVSNSHKLKKRDLFCNFVCNLVCFFAMYDFDRINHTYIICYFECRSTSNGNKKCSPLINQFRNPHYQ